MEEEIPIPTDEELWALLPTQEGEARADTLSALSISYSGTDRSQYAIALAEEAKEQYFAAGFDGSEIEFTWIWGVIAESNAELERYNEAIEAGLKYFEVFNKHLYPAFHWIRWALIRWYLEAYRFDEARAQFEMLLERYEFVSQLDFSDFEYREI